MKFSSPAGRLAGCVLLVVTAALATVPVSSQENRRARRLRTVMVDGREAADGEVLVRYRAITDSLQRARAESDVDADEIETIDARGVRRVHSSRRSTHELLSMLRANPDVEFAEPNYLLHADVTPNDPFFGSLWGLFNGGQSGGTAGNDISATQAWDISTGNRANVVGVIDTGIDYNHPDLAANIWSAPSPFSVVVGGLTINCPAGSHGFNAIFNTCDPMDDHDHGTHVAGTIGGVGNNGVGVAGVNWQTSMMGLKFLDASGSGWTSDAMKAIEFAIQTKAAFSSSGGANVRVLSNSWGGGAYSQSLRDMIVRANTSEMLFVAAAGNSGSNNDAYPTYPANYDVANVVAVAAIDRFAQRAAFSNYGANTVHLGAPGVSILSTVRSNSYATFSGTSMATPHVSGAAALLLSACNLPTATSLASAILTRVDPLASMSGVTRTGGRLNVNNAIRSCPPITNPVPTITSLSPVNIVVGGPFQTLTVTGTGFVTNSQVRVNGSARTTVFVSSSQVRATINASDIASLGTRAITVFNPTPGGGESGSLNLNVIPAPDFLIYGTYGQASTVVPSFNSSLPVYINGGPGNPTDWVGLFRVGAADGEALEWKYLDGSTTVPGSGTTNVTVVFTTPATAGNYQLRMYAKGFVRLATSATITPVAASQISINDVSVTEGDSGTKTATFTISLNAPNPGPSFDVQYYTGDQTATAPSDYVRIDNEPVLGPFVSFATGVQTRTINVVINGDTFIEPNEQFVVNLLRPISYTPPYNGVIVDGQGIGTIINDEAVPPATITGPANAVINTAITATIGNGPANPTDWAGLFAVGAPDGAALQWQYLDGTQTLPAAGFSNASLAFVAPGSPGTYEFRFYGRGFVRLATSAPITVALPGGSSATVTTPPGAVGGTPFQAVIANGPGATTDWAGVFAVGAGDSQALQWQYLNGMQTLPAIGLTSATLTFIAPPPGQYEVRLYARGFVRLATGGTITVATPGAGSPVLTVSPPSADPGDTLQADLSNGPGNTSDWAGLFLVGAPDSAAIQWQYLNGLQTPPTIGLQSATMFFTAPATTGNYEIRVYARGFVRLATSASIHIGP